MAQRAWAETYCIVAPFLLLSGATTLGLRAWEAYANGPALKMLFYQEVSDHMKVSRSLTAVCAATVVSCITLALTGCGGGGDGESSGLKTDACGVLGLNPKIVNGTVCQDTLSPVVQVTIDVSAGGQTQSAKCSGTLLTPQYVLTAAHCFPDGTFSARAGHGRTESSAESVFIHPNFGPGGSNAQLDNDIAILKLRSPLPLPTVPLLRTRPVESGDTIAIFGYGFTENGTGLGTLRSGEMRVEATDTNHILAIFGGEGSNTCQGDSGGPAFGQNSAGAWGVIGITSTGTVEGCGIGDNSVFTNLADPEMIRFIEQIVSGVGGI